VADQFTTHSFGSLGEPQSGSEVAPVVHPNLDPSVTEWDSNGPVTEHDLRPGTRTEVTTDVPDTADTENKADAAHPIIADNTIADPHPVVAHDLSVKRTGQQARDQAVVFSHARSLRCIACGAEGHEVYSPSGNFIQCPVCATLLEGDLPAPTVADPQPIPETTTTTFGPDNSVVDVSPNEVPADEHGEDLVRPEEVNFSSTPIAGPAIKTGVDAPDVTPVVTAPAVVASGTLTVDSSQPAEQAAAKPTEADAALAAADPAIAAEDAALVADNARLQADIAAQPVDNAL